MGEGGGDMIQGAVGRYADSPQVFRTWLVADLRAAFSGRTKQVQRVRLSAVVSGLSVE